MYREAILEFIRRKDEALEGKYIPDHTPEELWPYGEEKSRKVVRLLSTASDTSFCPWCLVHNSDCYWCEYGKEYGSCTKDDDALYERLREEVTGGESLSGYIEDIGEMDFVLEPILEAEDE